MTILSAVAAWANMNIYDLSQQEVSAADWATYYEYAPWAQAPARNLDSLDALVGDLAPADLGTRQVAAGMLYPDYGGHRTALGLTGIPAVPSLGPQTEGPRPSIFLCERI